MNTKKDLHKLVDQLPEQEVDAAARYLRYLQAMGDPFLRMLLEAPEEAQEVNDETRSALDDARRQIKKGKGRAWEEVRRELAGG